MEQPQPENKKPRGQLAAMLQNRGWEQDFELGQDINRSSSAPPLNLLQEQFDDQQFMDPRLSRPAYSPGPNNWNLWAPPTATTPSEQPQDLVY